MNKLQNGNEPKSTLTTAHIAAIPEALKQLPHWVGWRYEENPNKPKPDKVPYSPKSNGQLTRSKSNDPKTWGTFTAALDVRERHALSGIGLCMADGDGLTGIDMDHALDPETGELTPDAQAIVQRLEGCAYIEISPSGTGLRAFTFGKPQRSGKCVGKEKWLEVYDHNSPRYLTVTGNVWGQPGSLGDGQAALDWLHDTYMKAADTQKAGCGLPRPPKATIMEDLTLVQMAQRAANGSKFSALWKGDLTQYEGDHSSADMALCSLLAFWTDDAEQIDRLFRRSGLMREKWDDAHYADGQTYGEVTVSKAIENCTERYTPPLTGRALTAAQETLEEALTALEVQWLDETTRGAVCKKAQALLKAQGRVLAAMKAHQVMDYKAVRERMMPLVGLGQRDFDTAVKQAADTLTRMREGGGENAQSAWLKNFVFLTGDNKYADLRDGGKYRPEVFTQKAEQAFPGAWGDAPATLAHAREQNQQLRHDCYYPGEGRIVTKESTIGIIEPLLNTYNAPRDLPEPCYDAAKETLFLDHLMYVCERNERFVQYFLNWMAYVVQKPGQRINSVPLIIGPKGNGKSFIADLMTVMLGKSNVGIINNDDLSNDYQDGLAFKQLLVLEEVKVFDGQLTIMERLKPWVTNERVGMNRKGLAKITVDNVANTMAFSNHDDAIRIDKDERRYAVAISREAVKSPEYYKKLFSTFIPKFGGSVASILYLLKNRDLASFNPHAPAPWTEARDEMIEGNRSALEHELANRMELGQGVFKFELVRFEELAYDIQMAPLSMETRGGSVAPSPKKVASIAKGLGLRKVGKDRPRIGPGKTKTTVYSVRNHEKWATASESGISDYFIQVVFPGLGKGEATMAQTATGPNALNLTAYTPQGATLQ